MRRLASPSVLFGLWTLLFALPALPLLLHHVPSPRVTHHAMPATAMQMYSAMRVIAPLLAAMPISFPGFAIVFALWPRIAGRPLDAVLGRWQFALATVPGFVSFFVMGAIVAWTGPPLRSNGPGAPNPVFVTATITTLYVVIGFWLTSLGVFAVNVSRKQKARSS